MLCFPDSPRHRELQTASAPFASAMRARAAGETHRPLPALGEAAGHDDDDVVRLCPLARLRQMVGVSPMKGIVFRDDAHDTHGTSLLALLWPYYTSPADFAGTRAGNQDAELELYKRWKDGIILDDTTERMDICDETVYR